MTEKLHAILVKEDEIDQYQDTSLFLDEPVRYVKPGDVYVIESDKDPDDEPCMDMFQSARKFLAGLMWFYEYDEIVISFSQCKIAELKDQHDTILEVSRVDMDDGLAKEWNDAACPDCSSFKAKDSTRWIDHEVRFLVCHDFLQEIFGCIPDKFHAYIADRSGTPHPSTGMEPYDEYLLKTKAYDE